jgi:hypothetical protein
MDNYNNYLKHLGHVDNTTKQDIEASLFKNIKELSESHSKEMKELTESHSKEIEDMKKYSTNLDREKNDLKTRLVEIEKQHRYLQKKVGKSKRNKIFRVLSMLIVTVYALIITVKYIDCADISFYTPTEQTTSHLTAIKSEGKIGFMDGYGNTVIHPKYDRVEDFSEGYAPVSLNKKWGFIDINGKEVVSLKYDDVGYFSEGRAKVVLNQKWGFIDINGKEVVPLKYDDVRGFSEGLARVLLNEKWGFIDINGKVIIPLIYNKVEDFSDGLARANGDYINKKGDKPSFWKLYLHDLDLDPVEIYSVKVVALAWTLVLFMIIFIRWLYKGNDKEKESLNN